MNSRFNPVNSATIFTSAVLVSSLFLSIDGKAAEGPLSCSYGLPQTISLISCDILENGVQIQEITLNRGNCPSGSAIVKDLKAFLDSEPTNEIDRIRRELLQRYGEDERFQEHGGGMMKTFTKTYQYGDKMTFSTNIVGKQYCGNLLEYTITVNGRNFTWKTR